MTVDQEDLIWVSLRIFGLYFVLVAVMRLPDILGSIFWLIYLGPGVQHANHSYGVSLSAALVLLFKAAVHFIVYFTIGLYLLRRGQWVFKLIKLPTNQ